MSLGLPVLLGTSVYSAVSSACAASALKPFATKWARTRPRHQEQPGLRSQPLALCPLRLEYLEGVSQVPLSFRAEKIRDKGKMELGFALKSAPAGQKGPLSLSDRKFDELLRETEKLSDRVVADLLPCVII